MQFKVTILGSGAAIPVPERNPSAHLVEVRNHHILLDCAEGTQMQLRRFSSHPQKISHIFISHLHGDHYFGLIGLLTTFHLLGRRTELNVFGPAPLKEIIEIQLKHSDTELVYPLVFHPVDTENANIVLENDHIIVSTIPLNHRIPTCGYLIREKLLKRNIRHDFADLHKLTQKDYDEIKSGKDYVDDEGRTYPNKSITLDPPQVRLYAYCTDTVYDRTIIPLVRDADLLYHEATFAEDKAADATAKFHTTARQAAAIARDAGVKKLVIGHFSARYDNGDQLLKEAREIFPETLPAFDGLSILI